MKHMKKQLREVAATRTVGFADAVSDLGTHTVAGHQVPYSRGQVYKVLKGQHQSERLLRRIASRRPDLLGLRFVAQSVRDWCRKNVDAELVGIVAVAAFAIAGMVAADIVHKRDCSGSCGWCWCANYDGSDNLHDFSL